MNQMIHFAHLDDESLPIAAVEHNGRIAFANSALEALLGVPRKQIEGEWQLVHANAVAQPATDQNEVNKELLRNLAHEIKNPLSGIRGAAQLLEQSAGDDDRPHRGAQHFRRPGVGASPAEHRVPDAEGGGAALRAEG